MTADNASVRAQRAIVTVPPSLSNFIRLDPPMPAERALLIQRMPPGPARKILAAYDEPFWRTDGYTGQSAALDSEVGATIDISPESGRPGMLCAFMVGPNALAAMKMTDVARRQLVLDALVRLFGERAGSPIGYYEHEWAAEEWTRGCYMAHCTTGVLTAYGPALHEPLGRVHWAGSELAPNFVGSIDSAVSSGERVAREVLQAG